MTQQMTSFEQMLLREVANLPETHRTDVLAFVRYLRLGLMSNNDIERRYDDAIKTIRQTAQQHNISIQDIDEEIQAVRANYAHRA
jgi:hypothetical protein